MPIFKYLVLDRSGKKVRRTLEASTIETAKNSLRQAGYTILEIYESGVMHRDIDFPFLGTPQAKDMSVLCRQLASMLRVGVPVSRALAMSSQQTRNKKLTAAIHNMRSDIEKGDALSSAMSRHPHIFPDILVNMASAGEESGTLTESFVHMELYFDKAVRVKASASKALVYPAVLTIAMIVAIFVMMTGIIPSFLEAFSDMAIDLPAITKAVMAVSDFFSAHWLLIALIFVASLIFIWCFCRTDKGRRFFGLLALKLPYIGSLTARAAGSTFCRTLSLLLASGLSLQEGLELTAKSMNNIHFKDAVLDISRKVSRGHQLNTAICDTALFPPMVHNLVGIGEEAGDLDGMLSKAADYFDEEVEGALQKLLSLLEPAIILFLAVFVIIIVFAIFQPMMSLTTAYDGYF